MNNNGISLNFDSRFSYSTKSNLIYSKLNSRIRETKFILSKSDSIHSNFLHTLTSHTYTRTLYPCCVHLLWLRLKVQEKNPYIKLLPKARLKTRYMISGKWFGRISVVQSFIWVIPLKTGVKNTNTMLSSAPIDVYIEDYMVNITF